MVGTLWSTVATVRSGRRTLRPASRSPSNAWGLVTSWTSCRSMYRIVCLPGSAWTTWSSQIFSNIVRGVVGEVMGLANRGSVGRKDTRREHTMINAETAAVEAREAERGNSSD